MRRLTSCAQRPSGNCCDRPKVITAVPRLPNLPFASAPTSEDMAAGYEPPARHGLAGGRLRLRNGYPPRCAQRPGADGPSEDRGSEEPTPSADLTCRGPIPSSEDFGCCPDRRPFPFTLWPPRGRLGSSEEPRTVISEAAKDLPSRLRVRVLCSDSKTLFGNSKKPVLRSFLCINRGTEHSSSTGFPQIGVSNFYV